MSPSPACGIRARALPWAHRAANCLGAVTRGSWASEPGPALCPTLTPSVAFLWVPDPEMCH